MASSPKKSSSPYASWIRRSRAIFPSANGCYNQMSDRTHSVS
jgi:hypothetical protein